MVDIVVAHMNSCCKNNSSNHSKIEASTELIKAVSDPNRLRILCTLSKERLCVCDLAKQMNIKQNLVSFHLKVLSEAGILNKKREGNSIYYIIAEEWESRVQDIFRFLDLE